jgi:serine/threonine-protein kinase HipA
MKADPSCGSRASSVSPPLIELPKLLSATEHVMEEKDTEEELRLLFALGSSLGGARPKASVRE